MSLMWFPREMFKHCFGDLFSPRSFLRLIGLQGNSRTGLVSEGFSCCLQCICRIVLDSDDTRWSFLNPSLEKCSESPWLLMRLVPEWQSQRPHRWVRRPRGSVERSAVQFFPKTSFNVLHHGQINRQRSTKQVLSNFTSPLAVDSVTMWREFCHGGENRPDAVGHNSWEVAIRIVKVALCDRFPQSGFLMRFLREHLFLQGVSTNPTVCIVLMSPWISAGCWGLHHSLLLGCFDSRVPSLCRDRGTCGRLRLRRSWHGGGFSIPRASGDFPEGRRDRAASSAADRPLNRKDQY